MPCASDSQVTLETALHPGSMEGAGPDEVAAASSPANAIQPIPISLHARNSTRFIANPLLVVPHASRHAKRDHATASECTEGRSPEAATADSANAGRVDQDVQRRYQNALRFTRAGDVV